MDTPIRRNNKFAFQQFPPHQAIIPSSLQVMTPPNSSSKPTTTTTAINTPKKKRRARLPMIVDISIDSDGKQHYQVHETKKLVRKEMPKSNFDSKSLIVTPQKFIGLKQLSPNTLNRKRSADNDNDTTDYDDNDDRVKEESSQQSFKIRKLNDDIFKTPTTSFSEKENSSTIPNNTSDDIIWSDDVEELFLEALRIIPKNGLTKIKISGRTCGRNELISDFILTKTGKQRTRKQVSSHIQVIKNMKKNKELIELIKNGPSEPSLLKKFDEIFGKITFQKSIGASGAIAELSSSNLSNSMALPNTPPPSVLQQKKLRRLKTCQERQHQQKLNFQIFNDYQDINSENLDKIQFKFQNFNANFIHFNEPIKSHVFTGLKKRNFIEAPLKIKENANLTKRFPFLYELANDSAVPIWHGMCNVALPNFRTNDLSNGAYELNSEVMISNLPKTDSNFHCFTIVYSFGRKITQFFDEVNIKNVKNHKNSKDILLTMKFGNEFWISFNQMLKNSHDEFYHRDEVEDEENNTGDDTIEIDEMIDENISSKQRTAIRGITIKQIILACNNPNRYHEKTSIEELKENDIRSILLWEFNKVDSQLENCTTLRQIYLPSSITEQQQQPEQLPTPTTASIPSFKKEQELSPYSFPTPYSTDSAVQQQQQQQQQEEMHHPQPQVIPSQPMLHSHASLPNIFTPDPDFISMNQMRSFSSASIIRHPLSPHSGAEEEDDVIDIDNSSNGLMLRTLNSDDIYCDDNIDTNSDSDHHHHHHHHHHNHHHHQSGQQQQQQQQSPQQHLMQMGVIGKDDIGNLFKHEDFFW